MAQVGKAYGYRRGRSILPYLQPEQCPATERGAEEESAADTAERQFAQETFDATMPMGTARRRECQAEMLANLNTVNHAAGQQVRSLLIRRVFACWAHASLVLCHCFQPS